MSKSYDPKKPPSRNAEVALYGECAGSPALRLANWAYINLRCVPAPARVKETIEKIKAEFAEAACKAIENGDFNYFREFADCLSAVKAMHEGNYDRERAEVFSCLHYFTERLERRPTKGELKAAVEAQLNRKIQPRQWTRYLADYGLSDLVESKSGPKS
jgi:hypothetical protein